MKTSRFLRSLFFSITIASFLIAGPTSHAQSGGRLIVWRIPGLGNDLIVRLKIDGRTAADITYGNHFDAILPPGRHVLAVEAFPRPYRYAPYTVTINVRPGELYNFTAKGGTNQLVLKRS
jgi:hypothetical protein